jgi:hypothetical protein
MLLRELRKSIGINLLKIIGGNEDYFQFQTGIKQVEAQVNDHVENDLAKAEDVKLCVAIAKMAATHGFKSYFGSFVMTMSRNSGGLIDEVAIDFSYWPHAFDLTHNVFNGGHQLKQEKLRYSEPGFGLYPVVTLHLFELSK